MSGTALENIPETGDMAPETTVTVGLEARSYPIRIGAGILATAGAALSARLPGRRFVIITDETVAGLHLPTLEQALSKAGRHTLGAAIVLPPGEESKSFSRLEEVLDTLLARGIERKTVLLALGGGVMGDLVGFAAAIALRGLDFVQIPTTLLAQVDSSVGGKTGINTHHGKNLVGAFHQPRLVLADTATLTTLPLRDRRAGYAEVVKYGLIDQPGFFTWLETRGAAVLANDPAAVAEAVAVSCRAKAAIVSQDERESGVRALLNLGHTFGHAFEALCHFDDRLRHGEAVGLGIALAFALSARLGFCPPAEAERVNRHLAAMGLPLSPADVPGLPWGESGCVAACLDAMGHDKKMADGRLTFILARGIGKAFATADIPMAEVQALLETLN